jgi:hypothetical protein
VFVRGGGGVYVRGGGGVFVRGGGGVFVRGGGGVFVRGGGGAPVSSSEGDVLVVGADLNCADGQFLRLQTVSTLPPPPPWATAIGSGYRFTTSTGWLTATQVLATAQLSFNYLDSDVPAGEEDGIQVYYRAPGATSWRAVTTTLDTTYNVAAIPMQGPGTYALMTSVRVQLPDAGWNLFSYPVQGSQQVGAALASIEGLYGIVYSYVPTDTLSPWRAYAPVPTPAWVSDLTELQFGRGYWIYMYSPHDLLLKGAPAARAAPLVAEMSLPPAVVYGVLQAQGGLQPASGQAVEARIDGALCGSAATRQLGGQVVFVVKVDAATPDSLACGALGRRVTVIVAGRAVGGVGWDNRRALEINGPQIFLPIVVR